MFAKTLYILLFWVAVPCNLSCVPLKGLPEIGVISSKEYPTIFELMDVSAYCDLQEDDDETKNGSVTTGSTKENAIFLIGPSQNRVSNFFIQRIFSFRYLDWPNQEDLTVVMSEDGCRQVSHLSSGIHNGVSFWNFPVYFKIWPVRQQLAYLYGMKFTLGDSFSAKFFAILDMHRFRNRCDDVLSTLTGFLKENLLDLAINDKSIYTLATDTSGSGNVNLSRTDAAKIFERLQDNITDPSKVKLLKFLSTRDPVNLSWPAQNSKKSFLITAISAAGLKNINLVIGAHQFVDVGHTMNLTWRMFLPDSLGRVAARIVREELHSIEPDCIQDDDCGMQICKTDKPSSLFKVGLVDLISPVPSNPFDFEKAVSVLADIQKQISLVKKAKDFSELFVAVNNISSDVETEKLAFLKSLSEDLSNEEWAFIMKNISKILNKPIDRLSRQITFYNECNRKQPEINTLRGQTNLLVDLGSLSKQIWDTLATEEMSFIEYMLHRKIGGLVGTLQCKPADSSNGKYFTLQLSGESVKTSSLQFKLPCSSKNVREVQILAQNVIFIDSDLNLEGISVGIIAPKVHVIGPWDIRLKNEEKNAGGIWYAAYNECIQCSQLTIDSLEGNDTDNGHFIEEYKTSFPFPSRSLQNDLFVEKIQNKPEILKFLQPISFAKEFESMEKELWSHQSHTQDKTGIQGHDLLKAKRIQYYEQFSQRLRSYIDLYSDKNPSPEMISAISHLHAASLSRLISIRGASKTFHAFNIKDYFKTLENEIKDLKEKEMVKVVTTEKQKFSEDLMKKSENVVAIINRKVIPAINAAEEELNETQASLKLELEEILKDTESQLVKSKDALAKWNAQAPWRMLLGCLKVVGSACAFLGPKGAAVGAVIGGVASIGGAFLTTPTAGSYTVPNGVEYQIRPQKTNSFLQSVQRAEEKIALVRGGMNSSTDIQTVNETIVFDLNSKMELLEAEVMKMKTALEDEDEKKDEMGLVILEQSMESASNELDGSLKDAVEGFSSATDDEIKDLKEDIDKLSSPEDKLTDKLAKKESFAENMKLAQTSVQVVKAGVGFMQDLIKDGKTKNEFENAVLEGELKVAQLKKHQEAMFQQLIPMMSSVKGEIDGLADNLKGKQSANRSVRKWEVKKMLKYTNKEITGFTNGMKVTPAFQESIDSIQEAILLLVEMYDHIEAYQEKSELADFIANVNTPSTGLEAITDTNLKLIITKIQHSIRATLFVDEYKLAVGAFKQWVFPFAHRFILPDDVEQALGDTLTGDDGTPSLEHVVHQYKEKLGSLSTKIQRYKASMVDGDESLIVGKFRTGYIATRPFFVWKSEHWKDAIDKLLSGQPVELRADIDKQPRGIEHRSALKFKSVELNFQSKNEQDQKDLDDILKHFSIKLTHSGISVYRVAGKEYVMMDSPQEYSYFYERGQDGKDYVGSNKNQDKATSLKADFMKSPYTWWRFQLLDESIVGKGIYSRFLQRFSGKIDLNLEGDGLYLDERRMHPKQLDKLALPQFYEAFNENITDYSRPLPVLHEIQNPILSRNSTDQGLDELN